MAAQRFPNDFDGILAGAPVANFAEGGHGKASTRRATLVSIMQR
jgi:hypothetical protein